MSATVNPWSALVLAPLIFSLTSGSVSIKPIPMRDVSTLPNEPVEVNEPLMFPVANTLPTTWSFSVAVSIPTPKFPAELILTLSAPPILKAIAWPLAAWTIVLPAALWAKEKFEVESWSTWLNPAISE